MVSPLDDPESNLRELKSALALMTEVDWRTLGCKTCQGVRYHKDWHSAECRERIFPPMVPRHDVACRVNETTPGHWCR